MLAAWHFRDCCAEGRSWRKIALQWQQQRELNPGAKKMDRIVERIFIASAGGADMEAVEDVEAQAGFGLRGDRYSNRNGYWTGVDECQVTLIESEDMEKIFQLTGIRIERGEHRRNLVTRNVRLEELAGRRFQVGEAILEYDRPRPPCKYIESLTEPGMTRALIRNGGICARVVQSGVIHTQDLIVVL